MSATGGLLVARPTEPWSVRRTVLMRTGGRAGWPAAADGCSRSDTFLATTQSGPGSVGPHQARTSPGRRSRNTAVASWSDPSSAHTRRHRVEVVPSSTSEYTIRLDTAPDGVITTLGCPPSLGRGGVAGLQSELEVTDTNRADATSRRK